MLCMLLSNNSPSEKKTFLKPDKETCMTSSQTFQSGEDVKDETEDRKCRFHRPGSEFGAVIGQVDSVFVVNKSFKLRGCVCGQFGDMAVKSSLVLACRD